MFFNGWEKLCRKRSCILEDRELWIWTNNYGVIGLLQRSLFGQQHEVDLKNPDFCRLAEAYGVPVERLRDLQGL